LPNIENPLFRTRSFGLLRGPSWEVLLGFQRFTRKYAQRQAKRLMVRATSSARAFSIKTSNKAE
jgi:hypothetical protein